MTTPDRKKDLLLTALIVLGMVLALIFGFAARQSETVMGLVGWVSWMGVLFKQLLLVIIYPLVLASMVVGIVNLGDIRKVGGLAVKGLAYFTLTTSIAVVVGLVLVNVVQPGAGVDLSLGGEAPATLVERGFGDFFLEMMKNTFKNPFASLANGDVLAILAFGIGLGAVLSTLGDHGKPLVDVFRSLNLAMMRLTDWVMWLAPLGVFGLLTKVIAEQGFDAISALGWYVFVVLAGLGIHGFLVLPALGWGLGGVTPWRFFGGVKNALAVSFSTASSAATLPVTLDCVENNLGVKPRVAGFVLPLGATVNMDGTALYEAVAAMFIAQVYGIHLSLGQQVLVFITATTAAVGAAGIPGAGLITMTLVLTAVGLPIEGIGLILAVDRMLDMVRTTVNVAGDATGAVILDRYTT
ncbi:MAG: dicarboxylate/amino acid:cation symporter [Proteobacteria bacterium]|nr:dicarboxylate/amino acid:cation symporter [Pseudomonadota bacterium]MCP4922391.1 dicarboxylate/amino acid:cation symporter [Pseudomonadota bacterium]